MWLQASSKYHSRIFSEPVRWLKKGCFFLQIYFRFCNDNWFLVDRTNLMASFHQSYFDCTRFICSNRTITSQIFVTAAQSQCTETGYTNHARRDATQRDTTRRYEIYAQAHLLCAEPIGVSRFKANITRCWSAILISRGTRSDQSRRHVDDITFVPRLPW